MGTSYTVGMMGNELVMWSPVSFNAGRVLSKQTVERMRVRGREGEQEDREGEERRQGQTDLIF